MPSVADPISIRRMNVGDLSATVASSRAAFLDMNRRLGTMAPTDQAPRRRETGDAIVRQLLEIDEGGAWAAVAGGEVAGVAMAGLREGLWYLAQLHLDPAYQGRGIGRRLLDAALGYGQAAEGLLLHSSLDPRAMRCYQRAGFALEPTLHASGRVRRDTVPSISQIRRGGSEDLELVADVDRARRGAAHGPDMDLLLKLGADLFVADRGPRRGYAVVYDGPKIVAADDVSTAQALLWTALAESSDTQVDVHVLRADQQWAIDVAVHAGLDLNPSGPLCRRGRTGPLAPYLPHTALL